MILSSGAVLDTEAMWLNSWQHLGHDVGLNPHWNLQPSGSIIKRDEHVASSAIWLNSHAN